MKNLVILVGPPGSGKSTLAKDYEAEGYVRVSQDDQGADHLNVFNLALVEGREYCS
jgi:predicted kinase